MQTGAGPLDAAAPRGNQRLIDGFTHDLEHGAGGRKE
jgi:hypothetical protein